VAIAFINDTHTPLLPVRNDRAVRILFSCIPSEGHFRPLLPLAYALAARGHELAFAVAPAWEPRVSEEGFTTLPAGISDEEGRERAAPERREIFALGAEGRRPQLFTLMFAKIHAPAKVDELLDRARRWGADVIVHDSSDLAAPIVAASLGIPSVNHSFGAMIPFAVLERAAGELEPIRERLGLEPDPHAGAFRGLFVDLAPPSFAWEQPLGRSIRLRPVPAAQGPPPAWLDELEPPLVYITLGTVFNDPARFGALLAGLNGRASALVTVGRDVDPATLGPLPDSVRAERFVPQAHVLPRSAAVVSHGGSGTTLGALAHGIPLVLLPEGADQFDNADRAEAAGAAVVLRPGEVTAESVGAALDRVLGEPAFGEAAGTVAADIARMGTADDVAAAVEELAAGR
jgi:UDP:flavonoid glycosyltransferase YjiC (YdhE family)